MLDAQRTEQSVEDLGKQGDSPEVPLDVLKLKYQELHTQYREAFGLYLRGSTMGLAVLGVALGFLLRASLPIPYARIVAACTLIVMVLWYVASFCTLRMYTSLTSGIRQTSKALRLDYEERNYSLLRIVIFAGMTAAFPIGLILAYFIAFPPAVVGQPGTTL